MKAYLQGEGASKLLTRDQLLPAIPRKGKARLHCPRSGLRDIFHICIIGWQLP
jgi:hypothetical protein